MLVRHLRRAITAAFSKEKIDQTTLNQPPPAGPPQPSADEYLVFPTKVPIFPYYFYITRINKRFFSYLQKNNVKYVAACVLKPGESKKGLTYLNENHMVKELFLKESASKITRDDDSDEGLVIENNNAIFDEEIRGVEEPPVNFIDSIDSIYPMASCCRLFLLEAEKKHFAYLRSEIRLEIAMEKYTMNEGKPIMYVSGKKIKNESMIEVGSEHKSLMEVYNKIWEISKINVPLVKESLVIKSIEMLGGFISTLSYFTLAQKYEIFKTVGLLQRTKTMTEYLKEYAKVMEAEWKLLNENNPDDTSDGKKKEYFKEIYEHFQSFLGHKADRDYIKKVEARLATGLYPEAVAKIIECELQNMQDLGEGNPEINKKKQYINLLIDYPFSISAKESFDIQKAKEILDEEHYGMKKVKQRILEFIAVSKIKGEFKSKVLLLHGPPGVGKTSIVKSIAKCLNRPYGRISLGGEYDTSIMKGHRKTYIGAYPGKIFDTISKSKVENPVILLDEIDKVQSRQGGASLQDTIMEVLDPIQNYKFKDEFMDVEIDLSKVLFICTANELSTIFPPLLDRLERIELSGYTTGEKKQIFRKYIQPKAMEESGLPDEVQTRLDFTDNALHSLIEGYCKEAGIRSLVRKTQGIFNKIAFKYVKGDSFNSKIEEKELIDHLGLARFRGGRMFEKVPSGVIVGLAYNGFGGSIMYIEAAASHVREIAAQVQEESSSTASPKIPAGPPVGSLQITGNLHNVMKESCQLAYSYAKFVSSTFFGSNYLEINDVHLNFPEIEIGKDGPSAGVAITCSLLSLALNKPAVKDIAMTGEISLSGKVGAIGGVKEKTMGAKRERIFELIFPEDNRRDVEELEDEIKEGVTFHFVSHFFEVVEIVFDLKIEGK